MTTSITDNEKKAFLGHLKYEVKNMIYGVTQCRRPDGLYLTLIYVGIFTYMRNLYEFFYGKGKKGNAHAGHFIDEWKNKKSPPELKKWNNQINTHLSHLNYARVTRSFKIYPLWELYNHYVYLIIKFLDELPPKYMNPILKKFSEDLDKMVSE